jgi:hypothetical protein
MSQLECDFKLRERQEDSEKTFSRSHDQNISPCRHAKYEVIT